MKVINRLGGGGGGVYINVPPNMPDEVVITYNNKGEITNIVVPPNVVPNGILTINPRNEGELISFALKEDKFDLLSNFPDDVKTIIFNGNVKFIAYTADRNTVNGGNNYKITANKVVFSGTVNTEKRNVHGTIYTSSLKILTEKLESFYIDGIKETDQNVNISIRDSYTTQNQMPGLTILKGELNNTNIRQIVFPNVLALSGEDAVANFNQKVLKFPGIISLENQNIIRNNEHLIDLHFDNLEAWSETKTTNFAISGNASLKNIYVPKLISTNQNFVEVSSNQPLENIYTEADNVDNLKAQLTTEAANLVKPLPQDYEPLPLVI